MAAFHKTSLWFVLMGAVKVFPECRRVKQSSIYVAYEALGELGSRPPFSLALLGRSVISFTGVTLHGFVLTSPPFPVINLRPSCLLPLQMGKSFYSKSALITVPLSWSVRRPQLKVGQVIERIFPCASDPKLRLPARFLFAQIQDVVAMAGLSARLHLSVHVWAVGSSPHYQQQNCQKWEKQGCNVIWSLDFFLYLMTAFLVLSALLLFLVTSDRLTR